MKLIILLTIMMLTLVSCERKAEETKSSGDFKVEKLFTLDGCTSYRYYDGRTIHYTTCGVTSTSTYSCGKNCTQEEQVTTH